MPYNNYQNYSRYNTQFLRPRMFGGAVRNIIIANVAVFLIMFLFQAQRFFLYYFGLVPRFVLTRGFIWQLFTYMFVHGGFGHIFWNMFVLWMFGSEIESHWGKKEFYKYYFITGVGSGIITLLFSLNSSIPVVGASGAIYAVLAAFAIMFPNRQIYFYFLIPIKAKYFVLIIGVITFFSSFTQGTSQISHLTHLGGLLIGYLYLRQGRAFSSIRFQLPRFNFPKIRFSGLKNPFKKIIRKVDKSSRPHQDRHYEADKTMREELDRLLDKVNRTGYESLSEEERKNLILIGKHFADKDKMKN
jgi:membrane associated rhomboid family serine protease